MKLLPKFLRKEEEKSEKVDNCTTHGSKKCLKCKIERAEQLLANTTLDWSEFLKEEKEDESTGQQHEISQARS